MPKECRSAPEDPGNRPPLAPDAPAVPSEQAFRESLAELLAVYASVPVALLVIDPDRRVRRVNAIAARLAGRSEQEMIGLLPGESLRCLHHLDDPAGCGAGPVCADCPIRAAILDTLATNTPHEHVEACLTLDGPAGPSQIWLSLSTAPVTLGDRRHVLVCAQDLTARKQTEDILRESEELLRESQKIAGLGSYVVDDVAVGSWRSSDLLDEVFGIDQAYDRSFEGWANLIHPDDRPMMADYVKNEVWGQGKPFDKEYRIVRHNDGAERWVHGLGKLKFDAQGRVRSMHGTIRDITNRKRAQEALGASERKYRLLHESMTDAFVTVGMDGRIREFNKSYQDMLGYEARELYDLTYLDITPPRWHEWEAEIVRTQIIPQGHSDVYSKEYRRKDGTIFPVELRTFLLRDQAGRPTGMWAIVRDITERQRTQEALRQSEQRYRSLVDNVGLGVVLIGPDYHIQSVNAAQAGLFGKTPQDLVGKECFREFHKKDAACPNCPGKIAMESGRPAEVERSGILDDGQIHTGRVQAFPVLDSASRPTAFIEVTEDITDRKLAEGRLADARNYISTLFDVSPISLVTYKASGPAVSANKEAARLVGTTVENLLDQNFRDLASWKESGMLALADKALATGQPQSGEVRTVSTFGNNMWIACRFVPFPFEGEQHVLLMAIDISEHRRTEEQLRQAQKMEAIGQLAGGVAHDFRNQLTVIKGYGEMLLRRSLVGEDGRAMVQEILQAVERSTTTTGQLLAFSRQETLRPKVQSLRDSVADIGKILPHMIGEDIRLMILSNRDDCTANLDEHLFHQAILNLAANARDAMPGGGSLTIETDQALGAESRRIDPDLPEGLYAVVTVTDTGSGMDGPTLAKAFDPFFTTKDVGKGTGLGLAMVHGFVKQSGGAIGIESEPGRGTTVRLYFPHVTAAPADKSAGPDPEAPPVGGETVLLVEDEPVVRAVTAKLLLEAGYRVRQAADASAALSLFEPAEGPADVLVTDIVMPGLNGVALAQQLRAKRPGLAVLFISGYPGEETARRGVDDVEEILTKPFTRKALLEKVRQVLGAAQAASAQLAQRPPNAVGKKRPK